MALTRKEFSIVKLTVEKMQDKLDYSETYLYRYFWIEKKNKNES